jgi:molybdopterin-guanine dinucleotide biosynthesis adapter protein
MEMLSDIAARADFVLGNAMTRCQQEGEIFCGCGESASRAFRRLAMRVFSLIGECREKSRLVGRLVAELAGRGLRVSTIKRVSDAVDLEREGSGTWKHRAAGAEEVMIASASRFALMREMPRDTIEPSVAALVARMAPVDIVLLDGFRRSGCRKMEVVPAGQDRAVFAYDDAMVLAVTSEAPIAAAQVPWLPLSDIGGLADFVMANAAAAGDETGAPHPARRDFTVANEGS